MAVDFSKCLQTKVADTRPMPVLPIGTYFAKIKNYKERQLTRDGTTQTIVVFPIQILMADEDVDHEQLAEFKAQGEFSAINLSRDVFLTESEIAEIALHPVRRFLAEVAKVDVDEPGLSFAEALSRAAGKDVKVHIAHKMTKDGKGIIMNIDAVVAN